MFQGGCAPAIMRCAVAARAKRLEGKSVVERPGGCLGHPGPGRAGGRCGTLVLTEGWRSTRRPGPQGTSPFSSFGWRLLPKMSAKKSIERCSRLGIKASSPCGQNSEHIEDILKPENPRRQTGVCNKITCYFDARCESTNETFKLAPIARWTSSPSHWTPWILMRTCNSSL